MYKAREEGIDVAGDQYPYEWSSTPTSGCMFPRWSLEGGREKTLERLKDKNIREAIKSETINYINRFHGSAGCVLAEFSNDKKLEGLNLSEISEEFSFSNAIYRMTSLPASRIGLKNRGEIKKGYFADINIFKPEELREKATYVDPHQYSTGMKWVLVNGKIALKDGKKIEGRFGKVVRSKEG